MLIFYIVCALLLVVFKYMKLAFYCEVYDKQGLISNLNHDSLTTKEVNLGLELVDPQQVCVYPEGVEH
jgi:hypothetical protein